MGRRVLRPDVAARDGEGEAYGTAHCGVLSTLAAAVEHGRRLVLGRNVSVSASGRFGAQKLLRSVAPWQFCSSKARI